MGWDDARRQSDSQDEDDSGDELDTLIAFPHPRGHSENDSTTLPTHYRASRRSRDSFAPGKRRDGSPASTWARRHVNCFRSTATVLLVVYAVVAVVLLVFTARFFLHRHDAYAHSVFAEPLIPNPQPVEHLAPPSPTFPPDAPLSSVLADMDARLASLGLPASTLPCSLTESDIAKYAPLRGGGNDDDDDAAAAYLFALNLHSSELVFPTLARTLLSLAGFLGPQNVVVSIFENGSWDRTTLAMAHFAAVLTAANVSHVVTSDPRASDWDNVDRIAQLSVYRNIALAPVNVTLPDGRHVNDVVFVNDVFVCPRDALELIHQKRIQRADASCALDWRATHSWLDWLGFSSVKFYDNWVARSITGDMIRSRFDILAETRDGIHELFDQPGSEYSRARFRAAQPVPVYSCWNGMLAMSAAPFRNDDDDGTHPAVEFRSAFNKEGECAASECKTVARDFWARGLSRWIMVPSVHVTYVESVYTHPALMTLNPVARQPKPPVDELIQWDELEAPKSVVCYEYVRGFHLDLPYRRTREAPFR